MTEASTHGGSGTGGDDGAGPSPGAAPAAGWSIPRPVLVPPPTYWPASLALGIVLLLWGIVTSVVVSLVGLAVTVVALGGWIGDLRHERHD